MDNMTVNGVTTRRVNMVQKLIQRRYNRLKALYAQTEGYAIQYKYCRKLAFWERFIIE